MSDPAKPSKPIPELQGSEEARMRHALGLHDDGAYRRPAQRREHEARGRRFVKDGEVPVVVLNGPREAPPPAAAAPANRMAEVEEALKAERLAHERAQAGVERLETKLAHAEMAHAEALAAERQAREAAEVALSEAAIARQALENRVAELEAIFADAGTRRRKPASAGARSKRLADQPPAEPEPVKWWLPSYRARRQRNK